MTLELLGSRFRIESEDSRWIEILTDLWDGFVTSEPGDATQIRIEVSAGETSLLLASDPPLAFPDSPTLAEALRYWLVERAVERAEGVVSIHAAAVARPEGAALLVGRSGAGKTTLTLALLHRGWSLGSDDVAPLDLESGLVRPFPKPLGVRNPSLFDEEQVAAWEQAWPEQASGPVLVSPRLFSREKVPFRARWLFFVDFDPGSPGDVRAVTPAYAAVELMKFVRHSSPAVVSALARLCRGTASAELSYPSTTTAVALLERAISGAEVADSG